MRHSSPAKSTIEIKYWSSIDDLPIYYYWKIITTGSLEHLIYQGELRAIDRKPYAKKLQECWANIELEMIELQLTNPDYVRKLQDERRHYIKKIEAAITEKTLDVLLYEKSALRFENEGKDTPFNYGKSLAMMELHVGYHINDKKLPTRRYYDHLFMMKEEALRKKRQSLSLKNKKQHGRRKN